MGTPPASQRGRSARPSPRLASVPGQITTPAPLRATASISAGRAWVAWTSCQRASSRPSRASHSIGRAPVASRQSVDLGGLFGDVDVHRAVHVFGEARKRADRLGRRGAQRMDRDARR